ncbi:hypothetical protein [Legionella cardiaca]|uniref:Uncharacterized protein n=1 Tax=Legionella cardiaca TaxID=1071983 RepID=A0ABY8AUX5_9GAMM|nr:hypothetical protein [Legionella cardiaca]WED44234.1 hypothetical protein PXX05_05470 [Legionella cardiaca]
MKNLILMLKDNIAQTRISLSKNQVNQAKQYLGSAAFNLKELLETHPQDEAVYTLTEEFKEITVKCTIAYVYTLSDDLDHAINQNNLAHAKSIYDTIKNEVDFLVAEYQAAVKNNEHQSTVFIDFPRDYNYLARYVQQSLEKYHSEIALQKVCTNFTNALNFTETQRQFGMGMNRYRQFYHSAPATEQAEATRFNLTY